MLGYPAENQSAWERLRETGNERVRVVFPATADVDPRDAQRVVDAFESQAPLSGLPADVLAKKKITISLASQPVQSLDGWSSPIPGLIALPLEKALAWPAEKLHRVIRHELAHIGMGVFLNYDEPPAWFGEGFAEWVAGGLTCEGEARIRLDLLTRRRLSRAPPQLLGPTRPSRSRLSYDLFGTFFTYVNDSTGGAVDSGVLLESVRNYGVNIGIQRAVGVEPVELERDWQSYLLRRYGGPLEELSCDPIRG